MATPRIDTPPDAEIERIEVALGHLLRVSVLIAAAVVLTGGVVFLFRHHAMPASHGVFEGEPEDLRSIRGILTGARAWHGRSIIQFGVLLLVATPITRVVFSAAAFAWKRDWLYVVLTAIVLSLLLFSLVSA